jgi:predicted regulator of Ras-like GTPase activity (Roadblock/LC7/MglB family)
METALMRLLEVDGVLGALLLSQDGLPVASANLDNEEAETVGALATAMLASLRSTTDRLAAGDLQAARLTLEGCCIDIRIVQDLLLLLFHTADVDEATLTAVLPAVTEECLEFAL